MTEDEKVLLAGLTEAISANVAAIRRLTDTFQTLATVIERATPRQYTLKDGMITTDLVGPLCTWGTDTAACHQPPNAPIHTGTPGGHGFRA